MESVDYYDKHLDPSDWPLRGQCDMCGDDYDNDDLTRIGPAGAYRWVCNTCLEAIEAEKDDD
jgi:hypothetical protein